MKRFGFFEFAVLLISISLHANGQIISLGKCPKLTGMPDFNVPKYIGRWYEVEKYFFAVEATTKCTTVKYAPNFDVEISMLERLTNFYLFNNGSTVFLKNDGTADLQLDLRINQINRFTPVGLTVSVPYLVLDTDYYSYTIKYVCVQLGRRKSQSIWILSKDPEMYFSSPARRRVHEALNQFGLRSDRLRVSNNRNCDRGRGVF